MPPGRRASPWPRVDGPRSRRPERRRRGGDGRARTMAPFSGRCRGEDTGDTGDRGGLAATRTSSRSRVRRARLGAQPAAGGPSAASLTAASGCRRRRGDTALCDGTSSGGHATAGGSSAGGTLSPPPSGRLRSRSPKRLRPAVSPSASAGVVGDGGSELNRVGFDG
jgi:hypothetical protein